MTLVKRILMLSLYVEKLKSPIIRNKIFYFFIFIFFTGIIYSINENSEILNNVRVLPILAALLVITPIMYFLMSLEFKLTAFLFYKKICFIEAFKTTILSSIMNLLPLPGGAIFRVNYLKNLGISVSSSLSVTIYMALIWLACLLIYVSIFLFLLEADLIINLLVLSLGGSILIAASLRLYQVNHSPKTIVFLISTRFFIVVFGAIRLYLCFIALNIDIDFLHASILSASSIMGAASMVVPGGLGLVEMTSAFIGYIIDVNPHNAYLASALSRLIGVTFLFLTLLVFLRTLTRR